MPRKSLQSKLIAAIAPAENAAPPEPPAWLEDDAAAVWREVLADVPLGHLRAADLQLLPSYCRLTVYEQQLWEIARAKAAAGEIGDVELMREIRETTKARYMLGTKMRVVASANSRIDTGSNKRTLERSSKPWLAS